MWARGAGRVSDFLPLITLMRRMGFGGIKSMGQTGDQAEGVNGARSGERWWGADPWE